MKGINWYHGFQNKVYCCIRHGLTWNPLKNHAIDSQNVQVSGNGSYVFVLLSTFDHRKNPIHVGISNFITYSKQLDTGSTKNSKVFSYNLDSGCGTLHFGFWWITYSYYTDMFIQEHDTESSERLKEKKSSMALSISGATVR